MVVVISDLLDDPEAVVRGLKQFQYRGTDVIVFHVLDPDELEFPFDRATRFEDLETGEEIMAVPALVRAHYLKAIGGLVERYRRELGGAGIDYQLLNTNSRSKWLCWRTCHTCGQLMSFLSPLFLIGALAAAVPIVLHLLKRDPEPRVKFAAVALLRHAPVERTSTRRLRQIVLLAMRVAALVLLAIAFAQPFVCPEPQQAPRRDDRRARHFVQHVGSLVARQAARERRHRQRARRRTWLAS